MRIRVGDTVKVIAGNDKGESGEVLRVDRKSNRVIVKDINVIKKHQRPRTEGGQQVPGGIVEREAAVDASNVMLICPHTGEPTRVGIRRDEDGKRIRVSQKSGQDIE